MIIFFYSLIFLALTIYSYSQIDLNLNLSRVEIYLLFENQMKQLGFFNRPLSFWIFIAISVSLISLYILIIKKLIISPIHFKLKISNFKLIVLLILYLFAYPAFLSYDIFNYFFDAKILTKYYQNPYFHTALEYRYDTWLRFMRWTHRTYPYGPIWLAGAIVPVFLGFDKFVLTILTFKIFNLLIFLGCLKILQLILKKIEKPMNWIWAFALNPIVIYDFLISMHNESLMLLLFLVSLYYFVESKKILTVFFLLLSVGVKYLTIVFLPIYIFLWISKKSKAEKNRFLINNAYLISLISLIPLLFFRELYSWYFIIPIGLITLNLNKAKAIMLIVLSFLIFRYAPFILIGEYSSIVLNWQNWISWVVVGMVVAIFFFRHKKFFA